MKTVKTTYRPAYLEGVIAAYGGKIKVTEKDGFFTATISTPDGWSMQRHHTESGDAALRLLDAAATSGLMK
jgi:hypothetical protein